MAVPTTADRIAHLMMTPLRAQAWASAPETVGVRPSIRSAAAKHRATLKTTVAAVATIEPQATATMTANPLWPRTRTSGPVMTAKATNAVAAAMTGSQII